MLGELYVPSGLALETARAVLELEDVYACNVALGCPNNCGYCYGPLSCKKSKEEWLKMRLPKEQPIDLVRKQFVKATMKKQPLTNGASKGFFISFFTDPFHPINRRATEDLLQFLVRQGFTRAATLSKLGISTHLNIRTGMSIVSLDEAFRKQYEPNTLPFKSRIKLLHSASLANDYTWVSMEPYPTSAIWKQPIEPLLEELKASEVNLIVFGKWNYDKRASTEQAKQEYTDNIDILTDFCKSNNIRLHVKSETLAFIGRKERTTP
jgi:DNA repair photolyase